jgi:hypothetical protein
MHLLDGVVRRWRFSNRILKRILVTWFEAGTVNVFKKEDTSLRKANKECSEVRLSKPCFA